MSSHCTRSSTVQEFLKWHQEANSGIVDGLKILSQASEAVSVSSCITDAHFKESISCHISSEDALSNHQIMEVAIHHSKLGLPHATPANFETDDFHCRSYFFASTKGPNIIHICLWSSAASDLENTDVSFLDMACYMLAKKHDAEVTDRYEQPEYILEAFNAVSDGFIIYDKNGKVIAFNKKQSELFPSVADILDVGVSYDSILKAQLNFGQFKMSKAEGENWIDQRHAHLKIHGFTEEQYFDAGKTIRLTNYKTKSGGVISVRSDITELVQARQKALENEDLFRTLLVGAPIPLMIITEDVFSYANSFAQDLFEMGTESLVGQASSAFHWSAHEHKILQAELESGADLQSREINIKTYKGNKKTTLATGGFITYQGKQALFISLLDISELHETKRALEQSEHQKQQMLELIPDALIVQIDGKIEFANEGAARIFCAKNPEEMIGMAGINLAAPDVRDDVISLRQTTLQSSITKSIFSKHLRFDGEAFPSELHTQSVLWNNRLGTLNIIRDISKRREHENKLLQNEQEMALAQRIGRFGYWRLFLDRNEAFWSEELFRMHYLEPRNEYVSVDWARKFIFEDDREKMTEFVNQAIRTGKPQNFEVRVNVTDQKLGYFSGTLQPEFNDAGRVISVFGVSQNSTEQRELEDKLRQSQKMEAIGQLTGGIAHDFNNLLAVIQGNTELLLEMINSNDLNKQNRLNVIMNATIRGADLTSSMLAFGRTQELKPTITRLDKPVTSMLKVLSRTIEENVTINFESDDDLWYCVADLGQVENALFNLALNARDAMSVGGTLSIATRNIVLDAPPEGDPTDYQPGDYVMLSVEDTGAGISEEILEHVFEPFYTTKEVGKGTGLGLSMVYGFIKQSKGHISISSTVGMGTTVKMYLPRAAAH